jgi:poly-gamma-glutamate synthesis protein (capsule biosynthesis protein)
MATYAAPMRTTGVLTAGLAAFAILAGAATAAAPAPITSPADAGAPAVRIDPPHRTFTVAAVGDFLSENPVNFAAANFAPAGVRYDYEPLLRPLEPIIQSADLAICHMETPVGAPGAVVGLAGKSSYGPNLIAAAAELPGDLRRVGFDRCSTASNHSNDLGLDGIRTTLEAFDAVGISHTGTARTPAEAAPKLIDVNGVRVAHVAFARNSNTGFPADWWPVRQAVTASNAINDVAAARAAGAEVVIVSVHVFVEMQSAPTADDRAIVEQIIAGSHPDLIIIHGPHVVQPVERVNGTLVFWSLGNFISGMGVYGRGKYSDLRTLDGLLATVRFTERDDGSWATEPWTVLLCNALGSRVVYPGISALADPTISASLRSQMEACVARSSAVVSDLK